MPSRSACPPRTPPGRSRRPPGGSGAGRCRPDPASGSTRPSGRGSGSRPTTTRSSPRSWSTRPTVRAAIERLRRALDETEVGGIQTTLPFHRHVVRDPSFLAAELSTGLGRRPLGRPPLDRAEAVRRGLLAAALAVGPEDRGRRLRRRPRGCPDGARGRRPRWPPPGLAVAPRRAGRRGRPVAGRMIPPETGALRVGVTSPARLEGDPVLTLTPGDPSLAEVRSRAPGSRPSHPRRGGFPDPGPARRCAPPAHGRRDRGRGRGRRLAGRGRARARASGGPSRASPARALDAGTTGPLEIRAIIPGRIVAVSVIPGEAVETGQQLLVLEAMKMQNELGRRAPARSSRSGPRWARMSRSATCSW